MGDLGGPGQPDSAACTEDCRSATVNVSAVSTPTGDGVVVGMTWSAATLRGEDGSSLELGGLVDAQARPNKPEPR